MAGRKTTRKTQKPVRVGELRPWSELPSELLELIVSRLCIDDNVRLACVCKKLRSVVRPLCVVNQSPWLLYPPAEDGIIKFFDPSQGKFYFDDIPELKATRIHCSKDGWLLFSQLSDVMFLFNPFTDSFIDLPNYIIYRYSLRVALSCAPTSPDSVIFAIGIGTEDGYGGVSIGIFQSGDARWTTLNYRNTDGVEFRCGVGPVFCNGLFYCLSEFHDKLVGVFDPQKHTWSILPVPPPNLPPMVFRAIHMVEVKGELLLVFVSYPNKTLIFKLELSEMKWVEMESLNGATVFVSSHSALSATDAPRISRNSVYFSKYRCYGKSSYFYSFDDCRFHPANQRHEVPGIEKAIWIEPPKMSHLLFEELY